MDIKLQKPDDDQDVEKLLDLVFGKDRFDRAAYRYRQGVDAIRDLSFVIYQSEKLIASLRFWPIKVGLHDALLLGPIAVVPELQGQGYGIGLMRHGMDVAKSIGHKIIILVGDENYYTRVGFSRQLAQNLTMPGQQDESRLLAHELVEGALKNISGIISK